jgi:DNA-binding NtrC family response regulator
MSVRTILCIAPKEEWDGPVCGRLRAHGWSVRLAADLNSARRLLQTERFSVGLWLPSKVDDAVCREMEEYLNAHADCEWVGAFSTAALEIASCRDLILAHFFDHHTLPVDVQRLLVTLGHAHGHAALRQAVAQDDAKLHDTSIVGQSEAIEGLLRQIKRVAKVEAPVLITGESGSGKELTAQAIHRWSVRANGPFVPVNCGAIQPTLIQSALFGHAKGAFTGAARDERGLIEAASGGTVFLDEIGDLSLDLQINLLRFLQEKTITRVGSTRSVQVDVRVVAATNVDLKKAVASGAFREDLFYRLNVLPLRVPSLRERAADIELLAQHFFRQFALEKSPRLKGFSRAALVAMAAHTWPGNVRELINCVRRAMVMAEGRLITPHDLGLETRSESPVREALDEARVQAERSAIFGSLQHAGRNVTRAAQHLGVSRMTLYRLMAKHGIGQ